MNYTSYVLFSVLHTLMFPAVSQTCSPGCPTDSSRCLLWFSISFKSMTTLLSKLETSELSFDKLGILLMQQFFYYYQPAGPMQSWGYSGEQNRAGPGFHGACSPVGEMDISLGIPQKRIQKLKRGHKEKGHSRLRIYNMGPDLRIYNMGERGQLGKAQTLLKWEGISKMS